MKEGIAVSSGTAALQVAVQCLPLKKGDEIILFIFICREVDIIIMLPGSRYPGFPLKLSYFSLGVCNQEREAKRHYKDRHGAQSESVVAHKLTPFR